MQTELNALFDSNYALNRKLKTARAAVLAKDAQLNALASENARLKTRLALDARKKPKLLRPVHASAGLEAEYRRRLDALICKMCESVNYWIRSNYRANEPRLSELKDTDVELALDVVPANELRRVVRRLARRWQKNFAIAANRLARWFAQSNRNRSVEQLHRILREGGWSVNVPLTQAQRDILAATVHENVSLIRSIPSRYFTEIEGMVMRSVQTGRDLGQLTKDLQRQYGVTRKRATLIARDQNNKATGAFHRTHQLELGITEAIWVHSHAGKTWRRTHIANDGKKYDVRRGWFDPDPKVRKYIQPGELINCRCFSRSIIPGF